MISQPNPLQGAKTVRLSLPYPPSANKLWRAVKGRNIKSAKYRNYLEAADHLVPAVARVGIVGPYAMTLTADRPDRRRRDISNLLKPTEDLLQQAGVFVDDCDAARITLEWSSRAPAKDAQVHVTISPWGGE